MAGPGAYLFGDEERKELLDVMESGYLSRYGSEGDPRFRQKVVTFEKEFADYVGTKYAICVNGGTGALLICLTALGIGPGDEVIVPGYTFIASISAICYARAIPVLAEIDESLTIDPADIERKITPKTKAIMPVHMLGNPCNMDLIMAIAKKHNLYVIEDCCQINGGSYKGKKLGSFGEINAFSLNVNKTITTGDGGVVVTNSKELFERAFGFHDQGHMPLRSGVEIGNRSIIGLNFRVNELTGAVALAQLRKQDKIVAMCREKKAKLKNMISSVKGIGFRHINDEEGEIGTLLTLLFKDKETADRFSEKLGVKTLAHSGWHVYNNMEQILNMKMPNGSKCPFECGFYNKKIEYKAHTLLNTDDILSRAVNISIGVVDKGIGAGAGLNVLSADEEIAVLADRIKSIMNEIG